MVQQFHRLCWPLPQDLIVGLQQHSFEELATLVILYTATEFGTVAFLCECVCHAVKDYSLAPPCILLTFIDRE